MDSRHVFDLWHWSLALLFRRCKKPGFSLFRSAMFNSAAQMKSHSCNKLQQQHGNATFQADVAYGQQAIPLYHQVSWTQLVCSTQPSEYWIWVYVGATQSGWSSYSKRQSAKPLRPLTTASPKIPSPAVWRVSGEQCLAALLWFVLISMNLAPWQMDGS